MPPRPEIEVEGARDGVQVTGKELRVIGEAHVGQRRDVDPVVAIAEGHDWARAIRTLEWEDGDILAIGSSSTHPIARVFLGSSATKIIRYAPVPVIAVPGSATVAEQ